MISAVVTEGYGSFGSIARIVTGGFAVAALPEPPASGAPSGGIAVAVSVAVGL